METNNLEKLRVLYIGINHAFNPEVIFENYKVEFYTADNPFTASTWITDNGLPDGILCERKLPGGSGFGFFDLWIEQFDAGKKIPFLLLDDEKNQDTVTKALQKKIDDVYIYPVKIEVIISSGNFNKLEKYKRFKIPEVWFWRNDQLSIYRLNNENYEEISHSDLLPELDINLFVNCVKMPSKLEAMTTFLQNLTKTD